jgi:hypothetical protein
VSAGWILERGPHVTVDDVGTLWTRDDGSVWRVISYTDQPTVSWERIDGDPIERGPARERRGGVVASPITAGFVRLVREDAPDTTEAG